MKKIIFPIIMLLTALVNMQAANDVVSLKFNRTGTAANSVTVSVEDGEGHAISGATATFASNQSLKGTSNAITSAIVCPDKNANTNPTIELTLTVKDLPQGFAFNNIGLDIHALNGGSNYQERGDGVVRQWNVASTINDVAFGTLSNIDIAAGVNTDNKTHKIWDIAGTQAVTPNGTLTLKLTITKGTTNNGCFFGLSEVKFTTTAVEPEPEPDPNADHTFSADKVYYIQWKNTGANYITENRDKSLVVADKKTSKYQFWRLIPVEGKSHCYHVQNVVTERYLGSCNMNPSSSSRVSTSETAVEYYIGATAGSGEIAGCHYFSSTDCADYSNESAGPRALNKDGASSYIITWQAGTSRPGSYWKIVETTDEYQAPEPPVHGNYSKALTVYFRPCGMVSNTYLTAATVNGVDPIAYTDTAKPGSFHVPFSKDHGAVIRGSQFNLSITLNSTDDADLKANAYFDWDADGLFEAVQAIALDGTAGAATVTVPEDAVSGDTRMRIRLNSNGLDNADDDVEGFVYDFPFAVVDATTERKVTVEVNGVNNGTASLSAAEGLHIVGTQLTATATPKGNAEFHSWREGGVVVSREATYTFAVENRNMNLKAYFTPNTETDDIEKTEITNEEPQSVYDLQGRRVLNPTRGVYIVGDHKVLIK